MQEELRALCRRLLEDGTVKVVIGYGQADPDGPAYPVFLTQADEVGQLVWNDACSINLVKYLHHPEIRSLGKPALVVKGCDERALIALVKESQINRADIVVVGVACAGVGTPRERRCAVCDIHMPRHADMTIGQAAQEQVPAEKRYADLQVLQALTATERMNYWQRELARCVKCYACRQACPMCYCRRCIVDKNRPAVIDSSPTLKGNFAWHITRAFHLAGRCISCDQCTRACPVGIDLRLLNLSMAQAAEEQFGFRPGLDPQADPILGAYSEQDRENFIR